MKNELSFTTLRNQLSIECKVKAQDMLRFLETEMVLWVLETIGPKENAAKANILLGNQNLITWKKDWTNVRFLAQVHHRLYQYYPSRIWKKALENYQNPDFDDIRLYKITIRAEKDTDGKEFLILERDQNNLSTTEDRIEYYKNEILNYEIKQNKAASASKGSYIYFIPSPDKKSNFENNHQVVISKIEHKTNNEKIEQKSQREEIIITVGEIQKAISDIIKLNPKNDYFEKVIKKDSLKLVQNQLISTANQLLINETVNLVGMVSSGKSTLIKIIVYILAGRGKKIVIIQNRVKDVFDLVRYFRNLNLSASPYIGKDHMKYIDQLKKQSPDCDYLPDDFSMYLESSCIINGLTTDTIESPQFGDEPCFNLEKNEKKYACPYFDICPRNKMQRDALASSIIVTTIEGLASTRITRDRKLFLNYVLKQADLVIMDECDNIQTSVDRIFAPGDKFLNFIKDSAADVEDYYRNSNYHALGNENDIHYRELQCSARTNHNVVLHAISSLPSLNSMWNHYFSSTIMYNETIEPLIKNEIKDEEEREELLEKLQKYISDRDNLDHAATFEIALKFSDNKQFSKSVEEELKNYKLSKETLKQIKVFIIVSAFEEYIMDIYSTSLNTSNHIRKDIGLLSYLHSRSNQLQRFFPIAPLGNMFGMKRTDEGIYFYRQFAYGRVMVTDLPWLYTDSEGKPLGPHVLLLSGSSFAPGSLGYHINRPVNYILDIDSDKRNKLEETQIIHIPCEIRVSGSGSDSDNQQRRENLKKILGKNLDFFQMELKRPGKILVIANSYEEAADTRDILANLLKDTEVVYMHRATDEETDDNSISRDDIESFSKISARILVAPAKAIERAYNIVEENGNSTISTIFFPVRPMPAPGDIIQDFTKLNGLVAAKFSNKEYESSFAMAKDLRKFAFNKWLSFEYFHNSNLNEMSGPLRKDLSASLFVLILQIFGRAARIGKSEQDEPLIDRDARNTDPEWEAPHIYFLDGAFSKDDDTPEKYYDCLNEIVNYLDGLFSDPAYHEIATALYGPLYDAFKKGLKRA
jgi:hypothetical protein